MTLGARTVEDDDQPVSQIPASRGGAGALGNAAIIVGISFLIVAVASADRAFATGSETASWLLVLLAILCGLVAATCFGFARWRRRHRRNGTFYW